LLVWRKFPACQIFYYHACNFNTVNSRWWRFRLDFHWRRNFSARGDQTFLFGKSTAIPVGLAYWSYAYQSYIYVPKLNNFLITRFANADACWTPLTRM
jgi:hypothetical protein